MQGERGLEEELAPGDPKLPDQAPVSRSFSPPAPAVFPSVKWALVSSAHSRHIVKGTGAHISTP